MLIFGLDKDKKIDEWWNKKAADTLGIKKEHVGKCPWELFIRKKKEQYAHQVIDEVLNMGQPVTNCELHAILGKTLSSGSIESQGDANENNNYGSEEQAAEQEESPEAEMKDFAPSEMMNLKSDLKYWNIFLGSNTQDDSDVEDIDSNVIYLHGSIIPRSDAKGETNGAFCIFEDVTLKVPRPMCEDTLNDGVLLLQKNRLMFNNFNKDAFYVSS